MEKEIWLMKGFTTPDSGDLAGAARPRNTGTVNRQEVHADAFFCKTTAPAQYARGIPQSGFARYTNTEKT